MKKTLIHIEDLKIDLNDNERIDFEIFIFDDFETHIRLYRDDKSCTYEILDWNTLNFGTFLRLFHSYKKRSDKEFGSLVKQESNIILVKCNLKQRINCIITASKDVIKRLVCENLNSTTTNDYDDFIKEVAHNCLAVEKNIKK